MSNLPQSVDIQDRTSIDGIRPMVLPPLPEQPLVSVLIGNYNYGRYIGEAIESVLAQTYQRFEICICDDGSLDDSEAVIRRYASLDSRIRFVLQKNRGQGAALNSAWGISKGDVIALLDSDDVWLPEKLECVVGRLAAVPQAGFLTHEQILIRGNRIVREHFPKSLSKGWCGRSLLNGFRPIMPPCSSLSMRREVADRIFPLADRFRISADSLIMDRATLITNIEAAQCQLTKYRIHPKNSVGSSGPRTLSQCRKIIEFHEHLWQDREEFVAREYGIRVSRELWRLNEAAKHYLAQALLEGYSCDEQLLSHVRSQRQARLWRLLFRCPGFARRFLLQFRGMESVWKNALKELLGI